MAISEVLLKSRLHKSKVTIAESHNPRAWFSDSANYVFYDFYLRHLTPKEYQLQCVICVSTRRGSQLSLFYMKLRSEL